MTATGYFLAGTDTGAGKTYVTCALLRALNASGCRAAGMKPVATGGIEGADGGLISEDATMIASSTPVIAPVSDLNPYCLKPPVSPDIAAELAGIQIETVSIVAAYQRLATLADMVLVEGTGGWLAPIGARQTMADIAVALGLPVLLVVGLRLGCISHALLTLEAIRTRGCDFAGWIGNRIDPGYLLPERNLATLTRLLGAPPLAILGQGARDASTTELATAVRHLANRRCGRA
jgi:dethiobiotin synthetase